MKPASPRWWLEIIALGALIWQSVQADSLRLYSDKLLTATTLKWIEQFQAAYPGKSVAPAAVNPLTAVQALLNQQADLIAVGRVLTSAETAEFERRYGHPPLALPVGLDALGVVVHPARPRREIALAELEYLYAGTHRCHPGPFPAFPASRSLYLPAPATASYFHALAKVLCGNALRPEVVVFDDDAEVVEQVAKQPGALGLVSRASISANVRLLALVLPGQRKVLPTAQWMVSGHYPLSYYLYLYLGRLKPEPIAFARTALSPEGQAILARRFVPLPEAMRQKVLERLPP